MTIQEQHLIIEQGIQRMNYQVTDDFFSKEIDIALNNVIRRYLDDHYDPRQNAKRQGVGDSLKRILDLQSLRKEVRLPLFADPLRSDRLRVYVPADFWLHEEVTVDTYDNCHGKVLASASASIYRWVFELPYDSNYKWSDLVITLNGQTLFDATTYDAFASAITVEEEYSVLFDQLQKEVCRQPGLYLYRDTYDAIYQRGKLILVAYDITGWTSTTLSVTLNNSTTTYAVQAVPQTVDNRSQPTRQVAGRLVDSEQLERYLRNSFGKSTAASPLVDLSGNYLQVYRGNTFIGTYVNIKYIRKPAQVNLFLKQDCELHERVHTAINDLTIKHILSVIESDKRFQLAVAERPLSE